MKRQFLIIILLVFKLSLWGVEIKKDTLNNFVVGFYPIVFNYSTVVTTTDNHSTGVFEGGIRPYFAYNVYRNIFVGCNFTYDFVSSDFYKRDAIMEVGIFSRYIFPYAINKGFWDRLHPYIELGYSLTNYRMVNGSEKFNYIEKDGVEVYETFILSDKLNQSKISIPVGINFRLYKFVYLDINFQYVNYINGRSDVEPYIGFGFTW